MTKDEALREAIDALKSAKRGDCDSAWIDEFLENCTEALAQPPLPVQEPIAWMCSDFDGDTCELTNHAECENPIPLYTAPPQRQWVGLTDEEIIDIRRKTTIKTHEAWADTKEFARAVETKLKQKNHD